MSFEEYNKLTVKELKKYAEDNGIDLKTGAKKADIINAILAEKKTVEVRTVSVTDETAGHSSEKDAGREETEKTSEKTNGFKRYRRDGESNKPQNTIPEGTHYEDANTLVADDPVSGVLEIMEDGYGFLYTDNYVQSPDNLYISRAQIKRFNLRRGDMVTGVKRFRRNNERYDALLRVMAINGDDPESIRFRKNFDTLTPVFPKRKIQLENENMLSTRIMDMFCPVGRGQRGMIVAPPKVGKTTILKQLALSIIENNPDIRVIILLIDERPEEVTDFKETVTGTNIEIVSSTFDEQPDKHKAVSEITTERAKRLVEQGKDVVILLDSITRLARAYNITAQSSGRTLSGGLDPAALYMPKRFFGRARNTKEAGSLTILATRLVETGSRMDDMIFEEFKGTGNMELVLSRRLREKRIYPAIDILKSSTRRDDLLLSYKEQQTVNFWRRQLVDMSTDEATDKIIANFKNHKTNKDLIEDIRSKKARK